MDDAGDLADQYAALFNERGTPITGDDLRRAAAHIAVGGERGDLGPSLTITVDRLIIEVGRLTTRVNLLEQGAAGGRAKVVGD